MQSTLGIVIWASLFAPGVSLSTPPSTSTMVSTPCCRRGFGGILVSSVVFGLSPVSDNRFAFAASDKPKLCTDIETCREIGDQKVAQDLKENPVTRLSSGVRYKQLKAGFGNKQVEPSSTIDMIYSISQASGAYMYSRGFGYEKVDVGGGQVERDVAGLDSYRVKLGTKNLPIGVEQALVGMKKGERRRVEVPPSVGFATSDWKPEPTTRRGKAQIVSYQTVLNGRGTSQPPFPAPTIWDVEILSIR